MLGKEAQHWPDLCGDARGTARGIGTRRTWVATFKSELVDGHRFPPYKHLEHENAPSDRASTTSSYYTRNR